MHNFSNKGVLELKLPKKIIFNKKCAPKNLFFIEKNEKDSDDFYIENSL